MQFWEGGTAELKQVDIQLRKEKVWYYFIQGFTQNKIAEKLGVSVRTIADDMAQLKQDAKDWFDSLPLGQLHLYHKSSFDSTERVKYELWHIFETTKNENVRIKTLSMIANLSKSSSELVQENIIVKELEWLRQAIGEKTFSESIERLWRIEERFNEVDSFRTNCTCGAALGNSSLKQTKLEGE